MKLTRGFAFSCLALVVLAAFSGQAFAAHYAQVGSCTPPNPPLHTYVTIQAAVTASPAGTVIEICPGTYPEQVTIGKNLTLEGVGNLSSDAVVILPPAGGVVQNATDVSNSDPIAAQILVQFATVSISNLTVDGTGNGLLNTCTPDFDGILFQNASGTVNHVAVRNQLLGDVQGGCLTGDPIYVETGNGYTSTVTVENSSVHNYNRNGITGRYAGTTLNVNGTYVQGAGPLGLGYAAQNGIEVGFGAKGKITTNTVIDNSYVGPTYGASSILLYGAEENSSITVTGNILGNSQIPIGLYSNGQAGQLNNGVTVTGNKIFGTPTFDAIDVCSNGNVVTGNTIFNSAESGVHLDASCGGTGQNNNALSNTILESACAGVLDDWSATGGNSYSSETYYTVPFPVAYSAGGCTIPGELARAKTVHRVRPSE
ncbi:MAG: right-handed parallel beta-helix repeat-containing protein [Terriglobales bacterium]